MKKAIASRSPRRRPYQQKARAEASEATARRIMEAFFECRNQRWYDEITLEEVAKRAGVTVRTVIRRFGSKGGLMSSAFKHIAPRIRKQRTVVPGDITGAIARVVELYEDIGDGAIRDLAQEPRQSALKPVMELGRQGHRTITAEAFSPWLDPLVENRRREAVDALVVALDVYTWKLLRRDMGRTVEETKVVMRSLVDAILSQYSKPLNFLFTTIDAGGNVAPVMTVVARLIARGHRVRVMSDLASRKEVEAAGATFVSWKKAPSKPDRSPEAELMRDWDAKTPQDAMLAVIDLICGQAPAYAEDVIGELEREPSDLVVNFDMVLGVITGCEARGQKLALLSTMLSMFPIPGIPALGPGLPPAKTDAERMLHAEIAAGATALFDTGLPALNAARVALGLKALRHVFDQADYPMVRLLGTAQAFDFPAERLPEDVRYVGPLIRDPEWAEQWVSPWSASDKRPLVLVSFSTGFQNHAVVLQRVIDACAELPVRVLVTLGGSVKPEEMQSASNSVLVNSAPHNIVMPHAAVLVTHGGHGTVCTGLVHRLPMLVIPHGRDQADNAVRVTERGAGLSLENSASTDEIRAALKRLLDESSFRVNAHRLGDAVAAEAANSRVIEELEAAARALPRSNSRSHVEGEAAHA